MQPEAASWLTVHSTDSTGMRIRVGSRVQIEAGHYAWMAENYPDDLPLKIFDGAFGVIESWFNDDGERWFNVKVPLCAVPVPARFVRLLAY